MAEIGALAYYSTTVHERKNGWMKNFTRRNRNYRFLFKSLSKYIETTEMADEVAKAYRKQAVTRVRSMPRRRKACLKSDTKDLLDAITTDGLVSCAADFNQVTYRLGDVVAFHREEDKECRECVYGKVEAIHGMSDTEEATLVLRLCEAEEERKWGCLVMKAKNDLKAIKTTQLACHQPYNTIKLQKEQKTILCLSSQPTQVL